MTLAYLYDPELLVPSDEAALSLAYWSRLLEWMEDKRFSMGPATYAGFQQLAAHAPEIEGLPSGEFWRIFGVYATRLAAGTSQSLDPVEDYTPHFGSAANSELLALDLSDVATNGVILVATDEHCWPEGCARTESVGGIALHLAIRDDASDVAALREWYEVAGIASYDELEECAERLFPDIQFSSGAWSAVKSLVGPVADNIARLRKHLEVLNDHGAEIWNGTKVNTDRIASLGALGVEASPENAKTHRDAKAMRARKMSFASGTLVCEWHTKLAPNTGRVYFAVTGGIVHVGSITRHL